MYVILWKYKVNTASEVEFEELYGSDGDWVKLFQKSPDYCGTELIKNQEFYITIDRWNSKEKYEEFLNLSKSEFKVIDEKGESLTESETLIGKFEVV